MRLLECNSAGGLSFTKDLSETEVQSFEYAILSHTWGIAEEEINYEDVVSRVGTSKPGLGSEKLRFCIQQTRHDGLRYWWSDTCCIDKRNNTELSEALNSMFSWYSGAKICYVYLSDVSDENWEHDFQNSRWFRRGWTLQELIAPFHVEFYSCKGRRLGTKRDLEQQISRITSIPVRALQGHALSEFTIDERYRWQEGRRTSKSEDMAYSLLGLLEVSLPVIYGIGEVEARRKLDDELTSKYKGFQHRDFSVPFSLPAAFETGRFVARQSELQEIRTNLISDGTRRYVVLHGLGGIGKTQLAIAYAMRHRNEYSAVFWINIKNKDSVMLSFATIAKRILRAHPSAPFLANLNSGSGLAQSVEVVKAWLDEPMNTRWLLIFDNHDNPKVFRNGDPGNHDAAALLLDDFLPAVYQGSVIVTTRSSQLKLGHCIQIGKLEHVHDSLKILENESGRKNINNDTSTLELVTTLDGLPLALASAGAYLRQSSWTIARYLQELKNQWSKLQQRTPSSRSYEDRTLYSTWQISFLQVQRRSSVAAKLLCFWSYFDSQDLWYELLNHSTDEDPSWLRTVTQQELEFEAAMGILLEHGLVQSNSSHESTHTGEANGYSIHACVHTWVVNVLSHDADLDLAKAALRRIGAHVPDETKSDWSLTQRRLLNHANQCISIYPAVDLIHETTLLDAFHSLGTLYAEMGRIIEAKALFERTLAGREAMHECDYEKIIETVHKLGNIYAAQGNTEVAEQMYARALEWREVALGPEHPSTLTVVSNLGNVYAYQEKPSAAEEMYLRAIKGKEKALGPRDASTLDTVNNLGALYVDQWRLKEAETLYERALQGYENLFGPNHTSTLMTVGNLGTLYKRQDKMPQAEEMYKRALLGKELALGSEHPMTLGTVSNTGVILAAQGKYYEAEEMYRRALHGYEKVLPVHHTSILKIRSHLGNLYEAQKMVSKAETMYEEVVRGIEEEEERKDSWVTDTYDRLGLLYGEQEKFDQAEAIQQKSLSLKESALGPHHLSTILSVEVLAKTFWDLGKMHDCEVAYQQALGRRDHVCGPMHTSTLDAAHVLASVYMLRGKLQDAEQVCQRALVGRETVCGPDDPATIGAVQLMAAIHMGQKKLQTAEQLCERALAAREKGCGIDHATTLQTVQLLGTIYLNRGNSEAAIRMHQRGVAGYEKAYGPEHRLTLEAVHSLGLAYANSRSWEHSERMCQRALEGRERVDGLDHKSTLDTALLLSHVHVNQGKLAAAESMYDRALEGYTKLLGEDHQLSYDTAQHLGNLYVSQEEWDKAEKIYMRALSAKERSLGLEAISTLTTVNSLGDLYKAKGDLKQSEQLYLRVAACHQIALGSEDIVIFKATYKLATLYHEAGKAVEAEVMCQRTLNGYEKLYGNEHPSTLEMVNDVGLLYALQGRMTEAEVFYQRALRGYQNVVGPQHNSTLNTTINLGLLYVRQGRAREAREMHRRALVGYHKLSLSLQARFDDFESALSRLHDPDEPVNPQIYDFLLL